MNFVPSSGLRFSNRRREHPFLSAFLSSAPDSSWHLRGWLLKDQAKNRLPFDRFKKQVLLSVFKIRCFYATSRFIFGAALHIVIFWCYDQLF
jgi:hypothetical protein